MTRTQSNLYVIRDIFKSIAFGVSNKCEKADEIINIIKHMGVLSRHKHIGIYKSGRYEPDISKILEYSHNDFQSQYFYQPQFNSKSNSQNAKMHFVSVHNLEAIAEKLDVVFVPGIAFDRLGNRIGYGGGSYNAAFNTNLRNTIKIGLCFTEVFSVSDFYAGEGNNTSNGFKPHRMNMIITPKYLWICSKNASVKPHRLPYPTNTLEIPYKSQ